MQQLKEGIQGVIFFGLIMLAAFIEPITDHIINIIF